MSKSQEVVDAIAELKSEISSLRAELREFGAANKALVEIQRKLVSGMLGLPGQPGSSPSNSADAPVQASGPPAMSKPVKKSAQITVGVYSPTHFIVSGRTFDYNDVIKASGPARWEPGSKSWILPNACLSALETNLKKQDKVTLLVSEDLKNAPSPAPGPTMQEPEDELGIVQPPAFDHYAFQD